MLEGVDGEMKKRLFTSNNHGLAGVIEALLLIALVAIIMSTIQIYYIPQIMEQKEADHMEQVENQFAQLKSVIEIQSMMGVLETGESITFSPISSPLTLGSKQLPYFVSTSSSGQLDIIDQNVSDIGEIEMDPNDMPNEFLTGVPLTSIRYHAYNYYFVPQTYILEGGSLILQQVRLNDSRLVNSTIIAPGITVENHSQDGYIKIYFSLPLFSSRPGKNNTGGFKTCFIRSRYITHYSSIETLDDDADNDHLYIYSNYLDAWEKTLIKDDSGLLFEYYNMGYINVTYDDPVTPTRLEIKAGTKTIDVELTIVEIGVQTGEGEV
jgi:hypothetical protein